MTATDIHNVAQKAAQEEAARRALATSHADTVPTPLPLTPEQKAAADLVSADKKRADERAEATAKADQEFKADVAAAVEKRRKALEKYVSENVVEAAWEATKDPADPLWNDVQVDYRGKLQSHADSVERTGLPEKPSAFEYKVADLLRERDVERATKYPLTAAEVAAGKTQPSRFAAPGQHPQTVAEVEEAKRRTDANAKAVADAKAKADAKK